MITALMSQLQSRTRAISTVDRDGPVAMVPDAVFCTELDDRGSGNDRFRLRFVSPSVLDGVKGQYRIYLDDPARPGLLDTVLIFSENCTFRFQGGELLSDRASLFEAETYKEIEPVQVKYSPVGELIFESGLLGQKVIRPTLFSAIFVTREIDISRYREGITRFSPEFIWISPLVKNRVLPGHGFWPK